MKRIRSAAVPSTQPADLFVHEAGHAVIAWELGVKITELYFSPKVWLGRMTFIGGVVTFQGDRASERAREAAEKDMLIFHAGLMAQRLFHYDSACGHSSMDVKGLMDTAQMVEDDVDLIDAWSDYIEERVRVMLCRPETWHRVIALAPEIARRLYLRGEDIASFLDHLDVGQAVSPQERGLNRAEYAFGKAIDVLALSNRTRGCLDRAEIATIAELLTRSAADLRGEVWHAGAKTVAEVEAALAMLGLRLAEEPRFEREWRVQQARREAHCGEETTRRGWR